MSLVGCARFGDDEKKSGAEGEERTGLGEEKPRGSKGCLGHLQEFSILLLHLCFFGKKEKNPLQ